MCLTRVSEQMLGQSQDHGGAEVPAQELKALRKRYVQSLLPQVRQK